VTTSQETRIALLLDMSLGYCRDVIRGIEKFSRQQPTWVFHDAPSTPSVIEPLRKWQPDAVIAHLFDPRLADQLARFDVPVINTTSTLQDDRFPLVEVNHHAVGRMAAKFFLDRGYTSFGFFGSDWADFSVGREAGFAKTLAQHGCEHIACYEDYLPRRVEADWWKVDEHVEHWLRSLRQPAAVFVSNDVPARHLTYACRRLGLDIPRQIAILSVDNDEFECRLARPTLSSIAIPSVRIGYESAELAKKLLAGRKRPRKPLLLPPVRIVMRQSTDTIFEDDDLQAFFDWVRSNYASPLRIDEICRQIGVGRRTLERKMQERLGQSVLSAINQFRLDEAKSLLAEKNWSLTKIANHTGFNNSRRLCEAFQKRTGLSPIGFRERSLGNRR
jgi:LacI family transcriptional regulator